MNGMQILMINALNVINEAEKESRINYNWGYIQEFRRDQS